MDNGFECHRSGINRCGDIRTGGIINTISIWDSGVGLYLHYFTDMIVGFGFNMALIQRKDLQKSHLDSVFWLNLGVGAVFTGVAILVAAGGRVSISYPPCKLLLSHYQRIFLCTDFVSADSNTAEENGFQELGNPR